MRGRPMPERGWLVDTHGVLWKTAGGEIEVASMLVAADGDKLQQRFVSGGEKMM